MVSGHSASASPTTSRDRLLINVSLDYFPDIAAAARRNRPSRDSPGRPPRPAGQPRPIDCPRAATRTRAAPPRRSARRVPAPACSRRLPGNRRQCGPRATRGRRARGSGKADCEDRAPEPGVRVRFEVRPSTICLSFAAASLAQSLSTAEICSKRGAFLLRARAVAESISSTTTTSVSSSVSRNNARSVSRRATDASGHRANQVHRRAAETDR